MWFESKLYEELKEHDEEATLHDCLNEHSLYEYVNDFIDLNITQENYLKLIELCDFLMVTNVDVLVDKIVECFGVSIIHEFGDFYKYNSQRLRVHNKETLEHAIQLYCTNQKKCYETYGFSAYWNVSNITNMEYMFENCPFNGNISQWDVSNVTNMGYMFISSKFNGDISQWDVSKVTNMDGMFISSQFNGDISKWNVSKVTNMSNMFRYSKFNGDISQWDVSKVTNMDNMFKGGDESSYIGQGYEIRMYGSKFNGDISKWVVSNVTTMHSMFENSPFNGDLSKWKVSNLRGKYNMFKNCPFDDNKLKWKLINH